MKMWMILLVLAMGFNAHAAKMKDRDVMKCIDSDKTTKSAFQDLQAAYEMRIVSAKDFFDVMDKPTGCPQLRRDLKKLQARAISQFSTPKTNFRSQGNDSSPAMTAPTPPSFNPNEAPMFPPPPAPMEEFSDDFNDFR